MLSSAGTSASTDSAQVETVELLRLRHPQRWRMCLASFLRPTIIFTLKGRKTVKPELHQDYRTLCSLSNPVTEWLFGDDLSKKVKDMTEVIKVGQHVSHGHQFGKSRYNVPRGRRQGQKHFFDWRRFNPPKKRGNSKPTPSRL